MENVIEVQGLRKRYGAVEALRDASFTVDRGEIFGIVGPNGAGKTTTVECIAGLRRPDGGTVRVLGLDPGRDRGPVRNRLGIQLQSSDVPERLRVREVLALYASFYDRPADVSTLLTQWGLTEKAGVQTRKLSGGQRQRLSIALALVGAPEIVVLDELTTGLDPQARREAWALVEQLRAGGVTVVLVTHFMEEAERLCDRVAVVDAGRVTAVDTPAGLIARSGAVQRVRFRPIRELPLEELRNLDEVSQIQRTGGQLTVEGHGDLVRAVTGLLARRRILVSDLRVEQASLEDAYLALTGTTNPCAQEAAA
ncbi:ABC transporter ATP-binding protein [Asanoa sp. NPDC049573]|uniref:ABC transporter ATP-binding protein n=1 Tax=Asanoa sp. NPDC049573 TaxID=3155396 RepID=UPI00343B8F1B